MMPLGALVTDKAETRAIARGTGSGRFSDKPDSQEICFVQGGSYTDFLAQTVRRKRCRSGDIVDTMRQAARRT